MDPKLRAALAFIGTIGGLAMLEQNANRQADQLGLPHFVAGLIAAFVAHEI